MQTYRDGVVNEGLIIYPDHRQGRHRRGRLRSRGRTVLLLQPVTEVVSLGFRDD